MSNELPKTGYLRLNQIIGDSKCGESSFPLIPISKSSWWAGVKSGKYPRSTKLGPRTTVWKVEDIRALLEKGDQKEQV